MTYTVYYEYYTFALGCDCCHDSTSEIKIYNQLGDEIEFAQFAPLIEDEDELREFIAESYPQCINFTVHEDTRWF